jgi:hypothetical protein
MNQKIRILMNEFLRNTKEYFWFILFGLAYMVYFLISSNSGAVCLIKMTIGLPCPGCGMTRAVFNLLMFNFKDALFYHPLVLLLPLIFIVLFFKRLRFINILYKSKLFWGIILFLFISVYIIRMYLYFPGTAPMDYYEHSLLEKLFN